MARIDYERDLNAEQHRVVTAPDGPTLVLAGAGTGKTRTIVYRIAYLLQQGVSADAIMLLTFTNRAAREMMQRIELLLGFTPRGLRGGTFHHVGNGLLREYGSRVGLAANFTILDSEDSEDLIASSIAEAGLAREDKRLFPKARLLHGIVSFARNSCQDLATVVSQRYSTFEDRIADIERMAHDYEKKKRAMNVVDFDDLLNLWASLLEDSEVGEQLSRRFHHILVDEYQDTNRIQGSIIKNLGRHHQNIFVVGDDAQSIYSFRAATVDNILEFPKLFPGASVFRLEENYRSRQPILDLANASLAENQNQFEKRLASTRGHGDRPAVQGCSDGREEAGWIADQIMDAYEEGGSLGDFAVLFRASYQALELELELGKRGIPYILRGGIRFFERAHIKDVVAHAKLVANWRDAMSWQRLLKLEQGIGVKTAAVLASAASSVSSWESLGTILELPSISVSSAARASWGRLLDRLHALHNIDTVSRLLEKVMDGYKDHVKISFENPEERLGDLEQLVTFSRRYKDLTAFLSESSLSEGFKGERIATASPDHGSDTLVLSTIHQAKGLEWTRVFVLGLIQGQFPHYRAMTSFKEFEEERRLFYVAVTRAKDYLYLTFPFSSLGSSGTLLQRPSVFLSELPQVLFSAPLGQEFTLPGEPVIRYS